MKKLLSILGAVGLTATGASLVVSCGDKNNGNQNEKQKIDSGQIKLELDKLIKDKKDEVWKIEALQSELNKKYGDGEIKVNSITKVEKQEDQYMVSLTGIGKKYEGITSIIQIVQDAPITETPNLDALKAKIAEAKEIEQGSKSDEAFGKLQAAIAEAEKVTDESKAAEDKNTLETAIKEFSESDDLTLRE